MSVFDWSALALQHRYVRNAVSQILTPGPESVRIFPNYTYPRPTEKPGRCLLSSAMLTTCAGVLWHTLLYIPHSMVLMAPKVRRSSDQLLSRLPPMPGSALDKHLTAIFRRPFSSAG